MNDDPRITLTDSTIAAMARIATAPATAAVACRQPAGTDKAANPPKQEH